MKRPQNKLCLFKTQDRFLQFAQSFQTKLLTSQSGKRLCILLSILFFFIYLYMFFDFPTICHVELRDYFTPFIVPTRDFISSMPEKVFNLNIVESGHYRPRALGLLVQYIDTNMVVRLADYTPGRGIKQPFLLLAMVLMVCSFMKLTKKFFAVPWEFACLLGVLSLYIISCQTNVYVVSRSAKMLTPPICLLMVLPAIDSLKKYMILSKPEKALEVLICALITFSLCTLDEQVLATVVFLCFLGAIFFVRDRKGNQTFIVSAVSLILYASFHLFWGKSIFMHYTGGTLPPHIHRIIDVILRFNYLNINYASVILLTVLSTLIGFGLLVPCIHILLLRGVEENDNRIVVILTGAFSILLIMALITTHPPIFRYHDIWFSGYILPALLIYFVSFFMTVSYTNGRLKQLFPIILFLILVVNAVTNIYHAPRIYKNYLFTNGGHMRALANITLQGGRTTINVITPASFLERYNLLYADNIFDYMKIRHSNSESNSRQIGELDTSTNTIRVRKYESGLLYYGHCGAMPQGRYLVHFVINSRSAGERTDKSGWIEVAAGSGNLRLAHKDLSQMYSKYTLDFQIPAGGLDKVEFRVFSSGTCDMDLELGSIKVEQTG